MKKLITILTVIITFNLAAQVGIGTEHPDPSAILDLESTEKGFLPPRMTTAQRDAINSGNPSPGLVVYNIDIQCLEYFNTAEWVSFCDGGTPSDSEGSVIGDIKYSYALVDHAGWYLLDGRSISSLPAPAQTQASGFGFSGNLPDFAGKYIKINSGSETLGSTTGQAAVLLTQANLPNFNFNGTALSAGGHTHNMLDMHTKTNFIPGGATLWGESGPKPWNSTATARGLSTTGAHNHTYTISSNGGEQPVSLQPAYIALNTFVYLGE